MFQNRFRSLMGAAVLFVLLLGIGLAVAQDAEELIEDRLAIQGAWVRVDAPYILEFGYGEDGLLQSVYFNRRFINVARTETAVVDSLFYVQVELKDRDYDGSTYTLVYERNEDALYGTYLHGGTGNLYEVQFIRKPEETPEVK